MKVAVHEGRDYGSWGVVVVYNKLNLNFGSSCKQHSQRENLNKNKTKHGAFVFTASLWGGAH